MKRVLSQCLKELNQFRRDRLTVALAFGLPLAVLLIYGFAIRLEAKNIPLAVQDLDNSFLSRTYVERLFATQQFVPTPLDSTSPTHALDRGTAKATVVIPPDFERQIKAGKPVTLQALIDGTDVNNARVIQNSLRATTQFFLRSSGLAPEQARSPHSAPRSPLVQPRSPRGPLHRSRHLRRHSLGVSIDAVINFPGARKRAGHHRAGLCL
jgi:ABC-2 type transport system permease protein